MVHFRDDEMFLRSNNNISVYWASRRRKEEVRDHFLLLPEEERRQENITGCEIERNVSNICFILSAKPFSYNNKIYVFFKSKLDFNLISRRSIASDRHQPQRIKGVRTKLPLNGIVQLTTQLMSISYLHSFPRLSKDTTLPFFYFYQTGRFILHL